MTTFKGPGTEQYNVTTAFVDRHLEKGRGNKVAIRCGDRRTTYRELASLVNRVGSGLRTLGVQVEQRVLIVLPDVPEFAAAYFGAMKIGAVAVPTNTFLRAEDYAFALEESGASVVIVHQCAWAEMAPALRTLRHEPKVVTCGVAIEDGLEWNAWLEPCATELEPAPTSREDVAFWLWTSGSTGPPKAAVHLHGDWWHCCERYGREVLRFGEEDVAFSSSKLFHAYGLGNGLMFPLYTGASTVLYPHKPQPAAILRVTQEERPTVLFSVPTLYAAMLQEASTATYDLRSVRLAVSAAEPLPAAVFTRWRDVFGIEILDGIGSTEVLHIYLSARSGNVRPGSTGQPVPGYDIRIIDAEGQSVSAGSIGDLIVSGDSTAPYYWRRRAMTVDRMRGRWFFTGDKYWVDADGFYWYAGRSDDMFRVSGQWVSPTAVEGALAAHPAVIEAAVIAYQEVTALHTPKAFVVLKPDISPSAMLVTELQAFVKARVAPHQYPRRIEFVADLPKTPTGKLLRYRLRASESAGSSAARDDAAVNG